MQERVRGVTFAKQFPNAAEPLRGSFVAAQVRATAAAVDWTVIAPVPYVPRVLAGLLRRPCVAGDDAAGAVPVLRPRYVVFPRRLLYSSVGRSMARAARRAFSATVRDRNPAFVHAHALYPSGAAAARLTAAAGLPLIVTVHGSDLYANLARRAWRRELVSAASQAEAVVCVSSSLARDIVAELGVEQERVRVVPDCYDAGTFTYSSAARPPGGRLHLISVGRLVQVKGYDLFLPALSGAVAGGLDVSLVMVGDGPERGALEAQAARLSLERHVEFAGALPAPALAERLRGADAFVSPSRREGFGVAIVEALACGLPVLATRSGGPGDIVGQEDGILCDADHVPALAAGIAELADRLSAFDRQAIAERALQRFGPEAVGAQLVALYHEVVGRREGGRSADARGGGRA